MDVARSFFFVINPNASSGRSYKIWTNKILPIINNLNLKFAWSLTRDKGQASKLAQIAQLKCYDVVVSVGGDGTLNEIVNGLANNVLFDDSDFQVFINGNYLSQKVDPQHRCSLAVIPAGTGCDFARTIRVPQDYHKALSIMLNSKTIMCDLGKVSFLGSSWHKNSFERKRYFINIAGFGLDAEAVRLVDGYKKNLGSRFSFFFAGLKALIQNKKHKVEILDHANHCAEPKQLNLHVMFICNAKYCGGGMLIGPHAKIDDGKFLVHQIKHQSFFKTLMISPNLYSGKYNSCDDFVNFNETHSIQARSLGNEVYVECDGELVGKLPAKFSVSKQKIPVLVNFN